MLQLIMSAMVILAGLWVVVGATGELRLIGWVLVALGAAGIALGLVMPRRR